MGACNRSEGEVLGDLVALNNICIIYLFINRLVAYTIVSICIHIYTRCNSNEASPAPPAVSE